MLSEYNIVSVKQKIVYTFLVIFIILSLFQADFFIHASENSPLSVSSSIKKVVYFEKWKVIEDPSPDRSMNNIPDSLWQPLENIMANEKFFQGNYLIRTYLSIEDSIPVSLMLGLFPRVYISAFEIYWDGEKIHKMESLVKVKKMKNPEYSTLIFFYRHMR